MLLHSYDNLFQPCSFYEILLEKPYQKFHRATVEALVSKSNFVCLSTYYHSNPSKLNGPSLSQPSSPIFHQSRTHTYHRYNDECVLIFQLATKAHQLCMEVHNFYASLLTFSQAGLFVIIIDFPIVLLAKVD